MEVIEMKMAKASADDVNQLRGFLEWMENYAEHGTDERKDVDDESGELPEISDEDALEYIRSQFSRWTRGNTVLTCWRRVVWGYSILHDNVCDPDADHLDWNPELKAIFKNAQPFESPVDLHPFAVDAYLTEQPS
jgi:hypothetical protein